MLFEESLSERVMPGLNRAFDVFEVAGADRTSSMCYESKIINLCSSVVDKYLYI